MKTAQAIVFCILLTAFQANAALVQPDGSREKINSFITRQDVKVSLEKLGISPAEAQARAAALSPQEAEKLAASIDNVPAAGGVLSVIEDLIMLFADMFVDILAAIF